MQDAPDPALVFETLTAHQRSSALVGAIELDLFSTIARGIRQPDAIAAACKTQPRATRILCDFLVVAGLLTKSGAEYGLTPTSAVFLDRASPAYMGGIARFVHSDELVSAFRDVAGLVRRGSTALGSRGTTEPDWDGWVGYARSMVPLMMPAAQFMGDLAAERWKGPIRVLDIAAGHGMFGIAIAQRNPQARVVAVDWEKVLEVASENARKAGLGDRHSVVPGDALEIDYGKNDLVLLPNFLHHFDRATCVRILRKSRESLTEQGGLLILEFVPNEDRVSPPVPATFSFVMLGTTPAGDAYTYSELQEMGREAGLGRHEMIDVPNSAQRLIISRP